jgi:hypothetical protein
MSPGSLTRLRELLVLLVFAVSIVPCRPAPDR